MNSRVNLAALSQQALTEKLNEMVSDGLGFGQPISSGVTNLFKDSNSTHYCTDNGDRAHVGHIPDKHKNNTLLDKRKRIALTKGFEDIVKFVIDEYLTPAGINWQMSNKTDSLHYMIEVAEQLLVIYNEYIANKELGASLTCTVVPVTNKNAIFTANITFEMFCDKQNAVITYNNVELLTALVQNVSDSQIEVISHGILTILNTSSAGVNPYGNELTLNLFHTKLDLPRVLMHTMRTQSMPSKEPEKLFDSYASLLRNNIAILPNKDASLYAKTWQTLSEQEKIFVKAICNTTTVLYKACLDSNVIKGIQVNPFK